MVRHGKEQHLEGMRGIAAIVVLVFHCIGSFFPEIGVLAAFAPHTGWKGTLIWGPVNGAHAVTFFFVLSGYVLARRPLVTGDRRALVDGAIKRWPRLAGPVLVAVLAVYLASISGLDQKQAISNVTGSDWILRAGTADGLEPSLWRAFKEGAFLTFFRGDRSYIGALWTMRFEMIGSLVVFALAAALIETRDSLAKSIFLLAVAAGIAHYASPYVVPFVAGAAIALLKPIDRDVPLGALGIAACLALAFYLSGYATHAEGPYAFIKRLGGHRIPETYYHMVSSVFLILAVEAWPAARKILSGRVGRFLGRISFPIYLLHMMVISSAGAAVMVVFEQADPLVRGMTAIVVVTWISILVSLPLAAFNDMWVEWVNRSVRGGTKADGTIAAGRESMRSA